MIKKILTAAFIIIAGQAAKAETIEDGYVGCLTGSALDEFVGAAANNDRRQMEALLGVVCVPIGGYEFSVVDRGLLRSQIRVYVGSDSIVLWTVTEEIR